MYFTSNNNHKPKQLDSFVAINVVLITFAANHNVHILLHLWAARNILSSGYSIKGLSLSG